MHYSIFESTEFLFCPLFSCVNLAENITVILAANITVILSCGLAGYVTQLQPVRLQHFR